MNYLLQTQKDQFLMSDAGSRAIMDDHNTYELKKKNSVSVARRSC